MKKKRKRMRALVVPSMGPATNIRPAGAHKSKKLYDRHKMKAIFRKEEDGFFVQQTYASNFVMSASIPRGTK